MEDQQDSGVLASITIAQAALKTGYGQFAKGNNLFGIKATGDERAANQPTAEYINGQWIQTVDNFRAYDSWADSVHDHSERWLLRALPSVGLRWCRQQRKEDGFR
ncbi:glycoside hydrolase family 73 protein [Paenibacillus cremeus]|uniref:glycoside hydrolase family 73 protein n=1 Tax=Paenibacillus cremeus TaxID=2163881 RepID=UPI0021BD352A|nr:glucosaminidase domain-containing protein [Paenibacillus cremeus]